MTHLKEGDRAPDLQGVDQDGNPLSLANFNNKKLVLYFYPKDNTPTCTTESCNFRDNHHRLEAEGFVVLGVSPDSAKKHQNFINKLDLPFDLLVDSSRKTIEAYGVWGPKKNFGVEYEGVYRTTFVINEQGIIERIFKKVDSGNHTNQILETYN